MKNWKRATVGKGGGCLRRQGGEGLPNAGSSWRVGMEFIGAGDRMLGLRGLRAYGIPMSGTMAQSLFLDRPLEVIKPLCACNKAGGSLDSARHANGGQHRANEHADPDAGG